MRCLLLLFLAAIPAIAQVYWSGPGALSGPAAATTVTVSAAALVATNDNFNQADGALGSPWVLDAGSITIVSSKAVPQTASYARMTARNGTAMGVNQYAKITVTSLNTVYPELLLRMTDGGGCYSVQFQWADGLVKWFYYATLTGAGIEIASASLTMADSPITMGVTITGTGNDTTVRVWKNPTGLATTASDWDGDNTPDIEFFTNPPTALDTGNNVGMGGFESAADAFQFDDFYAGEL